MPTGLPVKHSSHFRLAPICTCVALAMVFTCLIPSASLGFWNPQAINGMLIYPVVPSDILPEQAESRFRETKIATIESQKSRQYLLYRDGAPIGTIDVQHQKKTEGNTVTIKSKNHFKRDGEHFETGWDTRFIEPNADEAPIRFDYHSHIGEAEFLNVTGEVDLQEQLFHIHPGDIHTVNLQAPQEQSVIKSLALTDSIPFVLPESEAQRYLFQLHLKDSPNTAFQFQTLELGTSPKLVTVRAARLDDNHCKQLLGQLSRQALKHHPKNKGFCFKLQNNEDVGSSIVEWRNVDGELLQAKSLTDNTELVYALMSYQDSSAVDIIKSTRIASNFIPHPRLVNHAQYKLTLMKNASSDILHLFPDDDHQRKMPQADSGILMMDVTSSVPDDTSQEIPIIGEMAYRIDTPLLQSTNPLLIQVSKDVVQGEKRAYFAAKMLRRWVFQNVRYKNYDQGFLSALDVLNTRSGDCTEHAVLLSAMLRSVGIPSRVVVGLLYTPADTGHSATTGMGYWVYHLWTEAQIGASNGQPIWASLDASQAEDVMDAAHLKLGDSPLESIADVERLSTLVSQLSGHLRIDVINAFSPQETVYNLKKAEPPTITKMTLGNGDASSEYMAISAQAIPPKTIDLKSEETLAKTKAQEKEYRVAALPQNLMRGTPEGAFQAGAFALTQDRYADAVEAFDDAIMQHRGNTPALASIGRRLFSLEMYRQSKRAFTLASSGAKGPSISLNTLMPWPELSEAQERQFQHSLALANQGESQAALSVMLQLNRQQPAFAPAYGYLAQWQNNPSLYQQFQQHAPSDPRPDMALGEMALKREQYSIAAQWFQSAAHKISTYPEMWQGIANEANAKSTIATALNTLRMNRRNADAWYRLGKGYQSIASIDQATNAYQQTLRYRPGYGLANAALLQLAIANHRWDKAATYASRLGGGQPDALVALGYYQMRQRNYSASIQTCRQALAKAPSNVDAARYLSESYMRRYDLYRMPADWRQSFNVLQNAISHSSGENRLGLERVYIQTVLTPPMSIRQSQEPTSGYYQQALRYAQHLVDSDWAMLDINSRVQQGRLLTLLNQYDDARKTLEEVLDVSPYDTNALAAMGYLAEVEQSPLQAMAFYQQALKQEPEQFMAKQGLHTVMIQEGMTLNRPNADWLLTPDEFDYLRLWTAAEAQWLKRQQVLSQKSLPLLEHWGDINLKAQAEREALWRLLWGEEQWQKAMYQSLKARPTPKRFEQFKFFALERLYTHIEWSMAQHAWLPNFTDVSMPQKRELMQSQFEKAVNNINATDKRYIDYIGTRLPVTQPDWNHIMQAAGIGNIENWNQLRASAKSGLDAINQKVAAGLKAPEPPSTTIITQPGKPTQVIQH